MIIKIIISCWPSFVNGTSKALRDSIERIFGGRALNVLDASVERIKIAGFGAEINGNLYKIFPSMTCSLARSKNDGIQTFSGSRKVTQKINDCDKVILIDHDHGFTLDTLERLATAPYDVIGAAYPYRYYYDDCYVAGDFHDNGILKSRLLKTAKGIQKVDWIGGGFVCVNAGVFEQIEYPWFRYSVAYHDGDEATELGSDISFCLQLKKAGIPVYCDCDTIVTHIK
jgi:hypothetical protein